MNKESLIKVLNTISVSGNEHIISDLFAEEAKILGYRVETDMMGNTYALEDTDVSPARILVEAHCDEIGFQVIYISDSGYMFIRRNGGIDEQCIPGSQFIIQAKNGELIPAVIGKKPVHLMTTEDRKRTIDLHQMWLDTGMDAAEVKCKISVGDYAAVRPNVIFLGENRITSKALDNKLGVFVLIEVMRHLSAVKARRNICFATTVQEEVGSRGAVICAHKVNPLIALTVDMDFATDVPDMPATKYGDIQLGRGPIIILNADVVKRLFNKMVDIADQFNIPYQISARPHATGGTNTSRIQLIRDGIRTIPIGIPCRYMHTPVEVCDLRDIQIAINLISEFCSHA